MHPSISQQCMFLDWGGQEEPPEAQGENAGSTHKHRVEAKGQRKVTVGQTMMISDWLLRTSAQSGFTHWFRVGQACLVQPVAVM